MTQEDKQLLLKDLSARLPYKTLVLVKDRLYGLITMEVQSMIELDVVDCEADGYEQSFGIEEVKPYLRPMSSMTDDEKGTYNYLLNQISITQDMLKVPRRAYHLFHWLLASHFDYYGLIEKGLALEAPEGMYKTE